jgi:hypothetical protein
MTTVWTLRSCFLRVDLSRATKEHEGQGKEDFLRGTGRHSWGGSDACDELLADGDDWAGAGSVDCWLGWDGRDCPKSSTGEGRDGVGEGGEEDEDEEEDEDIGDGTYADTEDSVRARARLAISTWLCFLGRPRGVLGGLGWAGELRRWRGSATRCSGTANDYI